MSDRALILAALACACAMSLAPAAMAADQGRGFAEPDRGGAASGKPLPDLTLIASTIVPQPLGPSEQFKICVTAKNIGAAPSGSFQVSGSAYGGPAPSRNINLAAGASQQSCLDYTASPASGSTTITITADAPGVVPESNETNNTLAVVIAPVQPLRPDLVILSTSVLPATLSPGQAFQACATVKNAGQAAAGPFQVVGGPFGGAAPSQALTGLAVGATSQACLNYPAAPTSGITFLTLTADALGAVTESNETNNAASMGITVSTNAPKPDLAIGGATQQPATASPGQSFQMCLTVQNLGQGAAGGFRVTGAGISGSTSPFQNVNGLGPMASSQVCLTYPGAPPSTTWLGFSVDSLGAVTETNESNNSANLPVNVWSVPADLTITSYWIEDPTSHAHITSVTAGHTVRACASIKNQSQGSAGAFAVTGSFWGGNGYSQSLGGLGSGVSATLCFNSPPATTPAYGGLSVGWVVDSSNQVQEGNEGNNSEVTYLQVVQ